MKVPSLVGLTKDQAVAALTDPNTHLSTNVEEVQTSASPAGTVIAQSAAAGTLVEQNSTITIRVAKAPAQTKIRKAVHLWEKRGSFWIKCLLQSDYSERIIVTLRT